MRLELTLDFKKCDAWRQNILEFLQTCCYLRGIVVRFCCSPGARWWHSALASCGCSTRYLQLGVSLVLRLDPSLWFALLLEYEVLFATSSENMRSSRKVAHPSSLCHTSTRLSILTTVFSLSAAGTRIPREEHSRGLWPWRFPQLRGDKRG